MQKTKIKDDLGEPNALEAHVFPLTHTYERSNTNKQVQKLKKKLEAEQKIAHVMSGTKEGEPSHVSYTDSRTSREGNWATF